MSTDPRNMSAEERLLEIQSRQTFFETIPTAAKFMSDLQRADQMSETREQRVGAAVDEAWPTEEDLEEADRLNAEYYEMMEDPVTISRKRYDELIAAENMLTALEQQGVDNWDGYSYAMKMLNENNDTLN